MTSLYYDEFNVGDEFVSSTRTVTETDVILFAGLTGDNNRIHVDEHFAKTTPFGTRIAHGLLGMSLGMGLFQRMGIMVESGIAYLACDNCRFKAAIKIGDTIKTKCTITDKTMTSKPERGIITFTLSTYNQEDVLCQTSEHKIMVTKKL
jgi:acyl dehydratase